MHDVILHRLRCSDDVPNEAGIIGHLDAEGILDGVDRS